MLRSAHALVVWAAASSSIAGAAGLTIHGDTAPDGDVSVLLTGTPGASSLLFISGGFLPASVPTVAGLFHLDLGVPWLLLPLGPLNGGGELVFGGKVPNDPLLLGATIHMQAYAGNLTNAVSIVVHPPTTTLPASAPGERFGELIVGGDLDGDGTDDVAITAVSGDAGSGEVRLFHGAGLAPGAVLRDPTPQVGGRFGASMVSADLTGDGVPDLVIGAAGAGLGATADDTGEVWIFHGPTFQTHTLLPAPNGLLFTGFGIALAAGDFDGDGATDLAVGAAGATVNGVTLAGQVSLYAGPTLAPMATLTEPTPETNSLFGAVLAAGDITGDGTDELAVGVPGGTVDFLLRAGEAFLYSAPFGQPPVRFVAPEPSFGAVFGCRLVLDDVLGGPELDLISGTPGGKGSALGNPGGVNLVGEVEIYPDADPSAGIVIDDPTPEFFQHFGMDVITADVNGDGARDLVVGSFLADSPFADDAGELLVFLGPDLRVRVDLSAPTPSATAQFGVFAGAADLDGDGRDELIIGAPFEDTAGVDAGGAYVVGW